MRILHIVTGMQKASGVTTFVENLVPELRGCGYSVDIVVRSEEGGIRMRDVARYDIVHIHGLWDLWLHRWARVARKSSVKIVWSPHGMLQPWALRNKWWKKVVALVFYQWSDLRSAAALHVTAQREVEDVRRIGLKNPVIVAPLGVNLHNGERVSIGNDEDRRRTLLFVSRVQRKKGLPTLLSAWAQLPQTVRSGWQIRIVGPDQDNHTMKLKAQAETLRISGDIDFVGSKYGSELAAEYQSADLFVLPTHSENFGSVVIEALAYGIPVICTKEAPWEELVSQQCGWWIDDSVDALCAALKDGLSLTDVVRREMGARGRQLVKEKYTWKAACDAMIDGYRRIVLKGD